MFLDFSLAHIHNVATTRAPSVQVKSTGMVRCFIWTHFIWENKEKHPGSCEFSETFHKVLGSPKYNFIAQ